MSEILDVLTGWRDADDASGIAQAHENKTNDDDSTSDELSAEEKRARRKATRVRAGRKVQAKRLEEAIRATSAAQQALQ